MENTGNIAKSIASNAEASATVTDRPVAFTVVDAGWKHPPSMATLVLHNILPFDQGLESCMLCKKYLRYSYSNINCY